MTSSSPFRETIDVLRKSAPEGVDLALVLGSGLSDAVGMLRGAEHISAGTLPGYPRASVAGHAGTISLAAVGTLRLIIFRGRTHIYERGSVPEVLAPVHVAHGLGARWIVLTNASGGIRSSFAPGDIMLIEDHLNFTFRSIPHAAPEASLRRSAIYDRALLELARQVASKQGMILHQGVYAGVLGPSYETAAEIAMLLRVGADAVGMSTVLEAEEAGRKGMKVLGVSLITNRATGLSDLPHRHDEVTAVGQRASGEIARFVEGVVRAVAESPVPA